MFQVAKESNVEVPLNDVQQLFKTPALQRALPNNIQKALQSPVTVTPLLETQPMLVQTLLQEVTQPISSFSRYDDDDDTDEGELRTTRAKRRNSLTGGKILRPVLPEQQPADFSTLKVLFVRLHRSSMIIFSFRLPN